MSVQDEIRSDRLLLRRWRDADRDSFASLNTDSQVMDHFPAALTREESDALADRIEQHFREHGFGLWAVEVPGVVPFAGFVGLAIPSFKAHFAPCVEVGWRLAVEHWGFGYATEGACYALAFGFQQLGVPEIVSFTVPENRRSRRVMERLGMVHDAADDFDHPDAPEVQRRHVLYRITPAEAAQHRLQPMALGEIVKRRN